MILVLQLLDDLAGGQAHRLVADVRVHLPEENVDQLGAQRYRF